MAHVIMVLVAIADLPSLITAIVALRSRRILPVIVAAFAASMMGEMIHIAVGVTYRAFEYYGYKLTAQLILGLGIYALLAGQRKKAVIKQFETNFSCDSYGLLLSLSLCPIQEYTADCLNQLMRSCRTNLQEAKSIISSFRYLFPILRDVKLKPEGALIALAQIILCPHISSTAFQREIALRVASNLSASQPDSILDKEFKSLLHLRELKKKRKKIALACFACIAIGCLTVSLHYSVAIKNKLQPIIALIESMQTRKETHALVAPINNRANSPADFNNTRKLKPKRSVRVSPYSERKHSAARLIW